MVISCRLQRLCRRPTAVVTVTDPEPAGEAYGTRLIYGFVKISQESLLAW
jgi:hypothetical protein